VRAGLERGHRSDVRLRRAVLEVLREERREDLLPEIERRIAAELDRAERAALVDLLAVMPGTDDEKDLVVRRVLRLDRFVDRRRAVDVLLIPEAVHDHHRNRERLGREDLVHRLIAPERVVRGMLEHLAPEPDLLETAPPAELAGRSRLHV